MVASIFGPIYNEDATETGNKTFWKNIFLKLNIQTRKFVFLLIFTAIFFKQYIKIVEVPISFNPRNYKLGKKIKIRDAIESLRALIRLRFNKRTPTKIIPEMVNRCLINYKI